jgi:ferredoxin-NADP reductase
MTTETIWRGGTDRLVLTDIAASAPGVKTFWFAASSGARFAFAPGQFVTLEVNGAWRCFTIASPPTRPALLALTIKNHGGVTAWMHDRLRPGMALNALPPAGNFALTEKPRHPLCLVSAGSGATPMLSIARYLQDTRARVPVHYVHAARTEEDLLFRHEIEAIARDLGTRDLGNWRIDWIVTATQGRPDLGRILSRSAPHTLFCCGPEDFMRAGRAAFLALGGDASRYFEESFAAPAEAPADDTAPTYMLNFDGTMVPAGAGETILSAALRANLPIPNACRQGVCGSCRIHKISGETVMAHQGGISDGEIAEGDILACCSKPRSDCVLDMFV